MWCTLRVLSDYLDCIPRFKSNRVCPYVYVVYTGEKNLAPSLFRVFVVKKKIQKDDVLRNSKKIS